jgi:glycosyltransferase involved in cell wall biosynthesis
MRVLYVLPYVPTRLRVRPYGFVRHLAQHHDIHVLALSPGTPTREALRDIDELRRAGIPVTVIQEPRLMPYLRAMRSALVPTRDPIPLQVAYATSPLLRAAIASELRVRSYDVIHVEHVRGLGALPTETRVPVVWDAVDCVSLLFEQSAQYGMSPLLRRVGRLEAQRLRNFERRHVMRIREILVTSERDHQALLKLAIAHADANAILRIASAVDTHITVLPHGISPRAVRPQLADRQPNMLIFSGKMNYHANIAGARMLVSQVMPLIWRHRPEVRLTIAGSSPTRAVRRLAGDGRITVKGYVRDLSALLSSACVAVTPLPYAVGIQNKILEAMAVGTPVVASKSAADGLQAAAGRDLLVGETAGEIASGVLRLLDDQEAWRTIAANGAAYVANYHDWDSTIDQLIAVYERVRVAGKIAMRQELSPDLPTREPIAVLTTALGENAFEQSALQQ